MAEAKIAGCRIYILQGSKLCSPLAIRYGGSDCGLTAWARASPYPIFFSALTEKGNSVANLLRFAFCVVGRLSEEGVVSRHRLSSGWVGQSASATLADDPLDQTNWTPLALLPGSGPPMQS